MEAYNYNTNNISYALMCIIQVDMNMIKCIFYYVVKLQFLCFNNTEIASKYSRFIADILNLLEAYFIVVTQIK